MILFTCYIVVGVVICCLDSLLCYWRNTDIWIDNEFIGFNKTSWDYTLLDLVLFVAILICWPAAVVYGLYDSEQERRKEQQSKNQSFEYTYRYWQETLSIAEIEARETYSNPVSTTNSLPFGYLNADWNLFKQNLKTEGMVGSFEALWPERGQKELIRGYVILDEVGSSSIFLTMRQKVKNKKEFLSLTKNTPPTSQHWKKPKSIGRPGNVHITPEMASHLYHPLNIPID